MIAWVRRLLHFAPLESDFLSYCNHDGLFADFHSFRHLFITRLEQAGISPKMAQTLARHSDVRLTLGVWRKQRKSWQTMIEMGRGDALC